MINFSIIDIIKNQLIKFSFIKNNAKKIHATGIVNDPKEVGSRLNKLDIIIESNYVTLNSCLEFGPGQTIDTIRILKSRRKFRACLAIDIEDYFGVDKWRQLGIEYFDFDDIRSIKSGSVDFIYAFDVLEHVRDPHFFMSEVKRLLTRNGVAYFSWDLRDHLNIKDESRWFDMHKYTDKIFNMQMSNRSSYVNRLSRDMWLDIFEKYGFSTQILSELKSETAYKSFLNSYGHQLASRFDSTFRVEVVLQMYSGENF